MSGGRLVGSDVVGREADAVAESVVDSWGRGGGGGVRCVGEGRRVGDGGYDAHGLRET